MHNEHVRVLSVFLFMLNIIVITHSFELIALPKECLDSVLYQDESCEKPSAAKALLNSLPDIKVPAQAFGKTCCEKESIGCYENGKNSTWRCVPGLPECMSKIRPDFWILTPENGFSKNQSLNFFDLKSSVEKLTLNNSYPLYVIIHGIGNKWPKSWVKSMAGALLKTGANVLVVKWSNGAYDLSTVGNFFKAVANSRSVASAVSKVISALVMYGAIPDLSSVVLIGFSLGAQIAGMVGAQFPGGRLPLIFGLDPQSPLFTCQDPALRLDPTDAARVVVFHTSGDTLFRGGMGTLQPMGHVDIYVNGGKVQPGCKKMKERTFSSIIKDGFKSPNVTSQESGCSHARAVRYFVELIEDEINGQSPMCSHHIFPCRSLDDWSKQKCLPFCPDANCPTLKLRNMDPDIKGLYFFNTQPDTANGGRFCGNHYVVSLTPNINVTGKLILHLLEPRDYGQDVVFQNHNQTLLANQENIRVFTVWSQIAFVPILRIKFEESKTMSYPDGKRSWKVLDCYVRSENNYITRCQKQVEIESGSTQTLELKLPHD